MKGWIIVGPPEAQAWSGDKTVSMWVETTACGFPRLCVAISQPWDQPTEKIKQAMMNDVTQYIGQQKVYDDVTLIVLK